MRASASATPASRLLVVRLSSLGDVVHAAPTLHDLRRQYPQAHIDWVVEEAFAPLVRSLAGVDGIIPIALRRWRGSPLRHGAELRRFWHALRATRYDAVLDLQGLMKSAVVARLAHGYRIGLGNQTDGAAYEPLARWCYDEAVTLPARIHVVDRSRELASRGLGYAIDSPPQVRWIVPALEPEDAALTGDDTVLLVHGSAKAVKTIPAAFWITLGRALVAHGLRVRVAWGTPAEQAQAELIAQGIGPQAALLPRLPLDRLLAVMSQLAGCIGVDTGLAHMAATLDRPTLQIFLEAKAWRAGVYWAPRTVVHQCAEGEAPEPAAMFAAWQRSRV